MKINELITKLQTYDQDKEVMVEGYETGFQPIDDDSFELEVVKYEPGSWYDGDYQYASDGTEVLVLRR